MGPEENTLRVKLASAPWWKQLGMTMWKPGSRRVCRITSRSYAWQRVEPHGALFSVRATLTRFFCTWRWRHTRLTQVSTLPYLHTHKDRELPSHIPIPTFHMWIAMAW